MDSPEDSIGMTTSSDAQTLSSAALTTTFLVFATTAIVVYFIYNKFSGGERWEKYGVKQVTASIRENPISMVERVLKEDGPTVGIMRDAPFLITRDLDLVKHVMVKDFNNFVNRDEMMPSKRHLSRGLFFLEDSDWKRMRQILSPSFSTGKLKQIASHVHAAARSLTNVFETCARTGSHVKVLHTTGQYSTSIIAKTAFGLHADCIGQEKDDEFTHHAKHILKVRKKWMLPILIFFRRFRALRNTLREVFKLEFLDACDRESDDYFTSVLENAIEEREVAELNGSHRHNDFLQSLVSTKIATDNIAASKTALEGDNRLPSVQESEAKPGKKTISKSEVVAQSVMTILAAFETTSTTLHFCLLKLAQHPDIQEKVFAEIQREILQYHDSGSDLNPSHEELNRLRYTEQAINETMRLVPPVSFVTRRAYKTWTHDGITIPADAVVLISVRDIHRDPSNWPDAETFDPERFNDEVKVTRPSLAFMPFGQGPRLCIGMRLAYLEIKAGLVHILSKVKVVLNKNTVPRKGENVDLLIFSFPRPVKPIELAATLREA